MVARRRTIRTKTCFVCLIVEKTPQRPFAMLRQHRIWTKNYRACIVFPDPFYGYLMDYKHYHSHTRSVFIYDQMTGWIFLSEKSRQAQSFSFLFYAGDNIGKWRYGVLLSMGHTKQVFGCIIPLEAKTWVQFFTMSTCLWQQKTDLPLNKLRCSVVFL